MAAGSIDGARRDEVETAWGLAAVWRADASRRLSRQMIDIHWLPRKYSPKLSIASALAVGLSALAGLIEIFKALLGS
ncbi:hypothetical protein [Arenivirga flava]|uniref:Uncharacterized protein n=1 Tax=Arenivirga flava TaxID=1930060 RepID=A0AA37XAG5_9MICO|nr:hypothetical protein [Arenivirga flava]GMA27406.1 hypothetical protein GCM10025874_06590 [Arenivirga flava]